MPPATVGAQPVDHLDARPPQRPRRQPQRAVGEPVPLAVDDQEDPRHPVLPRRVDQRRGHLGDVVGPVGQVDAGVEGRVAAEGEHHHRLRRLEAEDDGHHGEDVLGGAGGEGGRGRALVCGHAVDGPRRADGRRPSAERPVETPVGGRAVDERWAGRGSVGGPR